MVFAGKDDVERAVSSSLEAFHNGPWAKFSGAQRAACMNKFADLVEEKAEYLAHVESLATGRPTGFILERDLAHMVQVFRCAEAKPSPYQFIPMLTQSNLSRLCGLGR